MSFNSSYPPIKARIRCHGISRKPIRGRAVGEKIQFLTPETIRGMRTRFRGRGGQVLIMIGRWYSRQPLTSHK